MTAEMGKEMELEEGATVIGTVAIEKTKEQLQEQMLGKGEVDHQEGEK